MADLQRTEMYEHLLAPRFTITKYQTFPQWYDAHGKFDPSLRGFVSEKKRQIKTRMSPSVVLHVVSNNRYVNPKTGRQFAGKVWCREMNSDFHRADYLLFFELESDATIMAMTLNDV